MLLQSYQEQWASDFVKIKEVLECHLKSIDIRIEHIGSTSVVGLAAKPIIDIDLVYFPIGGFDEIKINLESLDYFHNGNQGIEGREVFKRDSKRSNHPILDSITHHLYVCHISSEELQRHLGFRDFLRENEKVSKEYEMMKYEIADKANQDRKEYASLKEVELKDFIEMIIERSIENLDGKISKLTFR